MSLLVLCRKEIQNGSLGHCPEEDARATMELLLLKLKIGNSQTNIFSSLFSVTQSFIHLFSYI